MYYFVYAETITIPYKWSPFVRLARQRIATIRAGSKMGCVELSNFHFCCAAIFCQPMKKFEFFGSTRATRQRHSKTSSSGNEDAQSPSIPAAGQKDRRLWGREWCVRPLEFTKRKWGDREGHSGRWLGYVDSTKVICGFRRKRKSISPDVRMTPFTRWSGNWKGGQRGNMFCQ